MENKFFTKILITYGLITFCIIFAIFAGYYIYIHKENQKIVEESNSAAFLSYANSCEDTLDTMAYVAGLVRTLNSMDKFVYSSKDDYYAELTGLYNDLSSFNSRLTNRKCQVIVHKVNDSTAVSSLSTTNINRVLNEYGIDARLYESILSSLPDTPLYSGNYIFTDSNIILITSKSYINNKMIILVATDIARFAMRSSHEDMNASFVVDESDYMFDLRDHPLSPRISFEEDRAKSSDGVYFQKKDAISYRWSRSRLPGLYYYYATDNTAANKRMIMLFLNMVLILLGIVAISFVIIWFFSIRLYKPIERTVKILMSLESNGDGRISRNSKDEIDYIAQQVNRIRNSNRELVNMVEDNRKYARTKLIHEILMGNYVTSTVDAELKRMSLGWLTDECFVIIFELSDDNREQLLNNFSLLDNVIRAIFEQLKYDFICEYIQLGQAPPYFIVQCNNLSDLKEKFTEIVGVIDTAFGLLLTVYIGSKSNNISELRTSFNIACRLLDNKNRIAIKNIYDYRDIEELPLNQEVYPINYELRIIDAIERNKPEEVNQYLNYIFEEYIDKGFENNTFRDLIVFALANTISRAAQKVGVKLSKLAHGERMLYIELIECGDSTALKQCASKMFDNIFNEIEKSNDEKFDSLRQDLSDYIEENIRDNITLLGISEHFNFSPNYMSYLFKTVMGDNFKNYLSKKQFDTAIKILDQNPSIKLAELGEQIGINNVNTLIRLFKKYSGLTPGEYVKKNNRLLT